MIRLEDSVEGKTFFKTENGEYQEQLYYARTVYKDTDVQKICNCLNNLMIVYIVIQIKYHIKYQVQQLTKEHKFIITAYYLENSIGTMYQIRILLNIKN